MRVGMSWKGIEYVYSLNIHLRIVTICQLRLKLEDLCLFHILDRNNSERDDRLRVAKNTDLSDDKNDVVLVDAGNLKHE